jgi:hypothetical protein
MKGHRLSDTRGEVVIVAADDGRERCWDEALDRLESFLLAYPEDRALPDPAEIVIAADLPEAFLREDDRARKIYLDALWARPLSSLERIAQLRTEVELLTLEVRVVTEQLSRADATDEEMRAASERVARVGSRLDEIKRLL